MLVPFSSLRVEIFRLNSGNNSSCRHLVLPIKPYARFRNERWTDQWSYILMLYRLQYRVHAAFFSLREDSFGEGDGDLNFPADDIKRAIVSLVLINWVSRVWPPLAFTYVTALLPDPGHLCGLGHSLYVADNVMYVGVVLHVVKPVVARHLLDLERLRG